MDSRFIFLTCQAGMENFLKLEFTQRIPAARFSFSQRGFVVFKLEGPLADLQNDLPLLTSARSYGESLFDIRIETEQAPRETTRWSPKALQAAVEQGHFFDKQQADNLHSQLIKSLAKPETPYSGLHLFLRDGLNPAGNFNRSGSASKEEQSAVKQQNSVQTKLTQFGEHLAAALSKSGYLEPDRIVNENATNGQNVLDICVLNPYHFWVGHHSVDLPQQRWPGGVLPVVPGEAPPISRAYYKLREAVLWSGIPYPEKLKVAEIGASPGGSCQWMLEQGMHVIGIDPADIDPAVASHPRFKHIRRRALEVKRKAISDIDWLVSDAILSPAQIIGTYEELLKHPEIRPKHLIITLKLPDLKLLEQLDDWKQRVSSWGYTEIQCRQMIFNRQEICMVASR